MVPHPRRLKNVPPLDLDSALVLDTNVVLDIWVFHEPTFLLLRQALISGQHHWIATTAMRDELVRVLDYPNVARTLARKGLTRDEVLTEMEVYLVMQAVAAPATGASLQCRDRDDQKFIDLALAHHVPLISRDREVLRMAKPLAAQGVRVTFAFP